MIFVLLCIHVSSLSTSHLRSKNFSLQSFCLWTHLPPWFICTLYLLVISQLRCSIYPRVQSNKVCSLSSIFNVYDGMPAIGHLAIFGYRSPLVAYFFHHILLNFSGLVPKNFNFLQAAGPRIDFYYTVSTPVLHHLKAVVFLQGGKYISIILSFSASVWESIGLFFNS